LLTIICGTFLYATFFSPANSSNPGPSGEQNNGHLYKEIEALRSQIGEIVEERNIERNLQTIEKLCVTIEKQAEEVNQWRFLIKIFFLSHQIRQMLEYENLHIGTIKDLRATVEQQAKEVN
jgi:hypothetical protein